jgi:hypothetical protein
LIVGKPKISGNWRKFHASANQIPESAEILIFLKGKFLLFRPVHHQNMFRTQKHV